jgi:hypothetical protein
MFDILDHLDPPVPIFELTDFASHYRSAAWDTSHHQAELSTLPFPGLRSQVLFGTQERVEAPYGSSISTTFRVRGWVGPLPADSLPDFKLTLRSAPVIRKKVLKEWRLQVAPEDAPTNHTKELIVAIDNGPGKLTTFSARTAEGHANTANRDADNAIRAAILRDGTVTLRWKSMKASSKVDDRALQLCLSWTGGQLASDPLVVLSAPTKAKEAVGWGAAAAAGGGAATATAGSSGFGFGFGFGAGAGAGSGSSPGSGAGPSLTAKRAAKRKRKRSDSDPQAQSSPTPAPGAPTSTALAAAGGLMEQLAALQLSGLLRPTSTWTVAEKRALIVACLD